MREIDEPLAGQNLLDFQQRRLARVYAAREKRASRQPKAGPKNYLHSALLNDR